jgi:hypothetical protein
MRDILLLADVLAKLMLCAVAVPIGWIGVLLVSEPITQMDVGVFAFYILQAAVAWAWVFLFAYIATLEIQRQRLGFRLFMSAGLAAGGLVPAVCASIALVLAFALNAWQLSDLFR